MIVFCCDERRARRLREPGAPVNGIDYIEVLDSEAPSQAERQRRLRIHFFNSLGVGALTRDHMVIDGGERVPVVLVTKIAAGAAPEILELTTDQRGDFSVYTFRLVDPGSDTGDPPPGFDPVLSTADFSFKVECPSDFDCRAVHACPVAAAGTPAIDFLAKDYASFRQLMLDRISVLQPDWQERNPADVGIALVELLAYAGDYLSYQQDAVATEAYLDTARQRVSIRRLARLVDYAMHDGCNARLLAQVRINSASAVLKAHTPLLTQVAGAPAVLVPGTAEYSQASAARPDVFETMHDITLYHAHETMRFYTWGDQQCCIPKGAVSATLKGAFPDLKAGDLLVFQEVLGPASGKAADADLKHRHAVRLTGVRLIEDPLGTGSDPAPVPLTEIAWAAEDALSFPLCVSALTDDGNMVFDVSVALGSIVLCDHGQTITKPLETPPEPNPVLAPVASPESDFCAKAARREQRARYRPRLGYQPLTQVATITRTSEGRRLAFDPAAPISAALTFDANTALPAIVLDDDAGGEWLPQPDLLSSDSFAEDFVAEVDDQGRATLRFGDDQYGASPTPGIGISARYRVGNGARGNVGAGSLGHLVPRDAQIQGAVVSVSNPMPARGGVDPETNEHVRQNAPYAFRRQERAVTAADYAEVTERHPGVQRAAATARWTGSWITMFVAVDRLGGRPVDDAFRAEILQHLEKSRMAGHDVEVDGPAYVALEVHLHVCVQPDYFRGDVEAALLQAFSSGVLRDGRKGFFHSDNFTFAQPVYLSAIYAVAQSITGVRFVDVKIFQRLGIDSRKGIDDGVLAMGRLEIARLDNDPNFPERGVLTIDLDGGK